MKYFIHLAYKGTKYRGWQRQPKGRSVQSVFEEKLSSVLGQTIVVHPCGRTDAGVHASQFFAHFAIAEPIEFDFVFRMNKQLPHDIAVYGLHLVPERANAQLDAMSRTYRYYMHRTKSPFLEDISTWYALEKLDIQKMRAALPLLQEYNDFESMCLTPDAHNHTMCTISNARIETQNNDERLCFEITGNRFLRGMVRLLTQRLVDIGTGKISIAEFENCLKTGERVPFHTSAKPQGLYLAEVKYPFLELPIGKIFE